ncbi:MAG: murein biosynthesis integral membrane protein MurJ, partial [Phenylobacterium sp.]
VLGASTTIAADAFYTANAFPNLFRRILAEGAFTAAFVPGYSRRLADDEGKADRFASEALACVALAALVISTVCLLAMPWLMYAINPGYVSNPAKFKLAIVLTQITMMYLPFIVIASLFASVLNARGRFAVSALYPSILNVCNLAFVIPQKDPVHAAYAASISVIVSGLLQAGIVWWFAKKTGCRIRLVRPRLTPDMKQLVKVGGPNAISQSATQINIFITGILASQVAGGRTWNEVAARLYQLPLSLVGVAIGVALLPRLAQALQREDHDEAQGSMDLAMVFALALSLPAAAALVSIPFFLIDGLFTRGQFVAADSQGAANLLLHFGWGVPAFVLLRVLQPAFFARDDTKTPMKYSLISVAVNIGLGVSLFPLIGLAGVAVATSAAAWISVIQMAVALWRRDVYRPSKHAMSKMARITAASVIMGVVLAVLSYLRPELEAPLRAHMEHGAKEIALLATCGIGAAVYAVLLLALGGVTMAEIRTATKRTRGQAPAPQPDLS